MAENCYKEAITQIGLYKHDETIKTIDKIFAKEANEMENEVKLSLLRLRAQSYYKLDRFTETVEDINSLVDMGLVLNENDDLFVMYHRASVQCKMDDTIESLKQAKLVSADSAPLQINIASSFNKNDRSRKRSQSADRKPKKVSTND